ncbi:hypothetical protein CHU92_07815 [Flavobacterium cyanobacteriorum]|uniref:FecR protein domain-containing protein n=1 Tax=Flavobacterium cyanobacteriorum TaxID=2022802 RepID=A0A255Z9W5_9FLAO|nr:FecR domain-containing protein [Flavobacterium cyanobacteriorum]OYQ37655.1 hypothetical protein CHU92_07815 [Flavobacterium cyanobacteriorum]
MQEDTKLARWLNNEMDEAELKAFAATPEYETYCKIRDYSAGLTVPDGDLDGLYKKIMLRRQKQVNKIRLSAIIPRIAAILVIAVCLTWFFYINRTITQIASAGKRIEFVLPDKSDVLLNSGSEVSFKPNRWENERKIVLRGEAFFKVSKGEVFDVETALGTVTVVGTQFNVKARDNRFEVTCFEGKVKVVYRSEIVYLLQGESVAFEDGKAIAIPDNDDIRQPGWITFETTFTSERPENIIRELERQYNVAIKLEGKPEGSLFTGTIPMDNIDTALEFLESTYHLKSEKKGNTIILSSE